MLCKYLFSPWNSAQQIWNGHRVWNSSLSTFDYAVRFRTLTAQSESNSSIHLHETTRGSLLARCSRNQLVPCVVSDQAYISIPLFSQESWKSKYFTPCRLLSMITAAFPDLQTYVWEAFNDRQLKIIRTIFQRGRTRLFSNLRDRFWFQETELNAGALRSSLSSNDFGCETQYAMKDQYRQGCGFSSYRLSTLSWLQEVVIFAF